MAHRTKVRGRRLDQLCDENVFYVERGNGGCPIVEGCNDAFSSVLSPIGPGNELIQAGTKANKP
jgi:hypothetical protein